MLNAAANPLVPRTSHNAFFTFLIEGPRSANMLGEILDKCPDTQFDPNNTSNHHQWVWERFDDDSDKPWLQTMYWDCIFAADLWKNGPASPGVDARRKFPVLNPTGFALLPSIDQIKDELGQIAENAKKTPASLLSTALDAIKDFKTVRGIAQALAAEAAAAAKDAACTLAGPLGKLVGC
jgi:hypothetical protein